MLATGAPQSEALGHLGSRFINDTTDYQNLKVGIIYCVAAATFTTLTSDVLPSGTAVMQGTLSQISLAPGMIIYGLWTRIKLAGGAVIAYNA